MTPEVRPAGARDVDALVALRLENAAVHVALDPTVYRVPARQAVRDDVLARLADGDGRAALLVAVLDDEVLGLADVAVDAPPPEHHVLRPVPTAHVHLVVARSARGRGVGGRLEEAAAAWAVEHGVQQLVAGVQADNGPALRFYAARGYRDNGVVRLRDL